jgi:hypothetical protein
MENSVFVLAAAPEEAKKGARYPTFERLKRNDGLRASPDCDHVHAANDLGMDALSETTKKILSERKTKRQESLNK